jgi:hypothetical protein
MARLSETQQRDLLIAVGLGDFLVGGKLTAVTKKALMATLRALKPVAISEAKGLTRLAARGVIGAARFLPHVAKTNPWVLAATLATAGYIKREEIGEVARAVADDPRTQAVYEDLLAGGEVVQQTLQPFAELVGPPRIRPVSKRRVSKANQAVKVAMGWLRGGGKALTGAAIGTLPKGAFKIATKAAGMANPKTKSKPGKGKSIMNKLARRLKKWW